MKKILLLLFCFTIFAGVADARTIYIREAYTGGTVNSLDGIDGDRLSDGDICIVQFAFGTTSRRSSTHYLDADADEAENGIRVIVPDTNPGTKCWIWEPPFPVETSEPDGMLDEDIWIDSTE